MADASDPGATVSPLRARLAAVRPVFDRVFFGLALAGALVAVHLLVQQGRGFDRGCLGFSEPAAAAQASTFNCELVTQSGAGTLLGVSNGWWGLAFYLAVAGLSAGAAFFARQRFSFAAARAALLAGGLAYSAYLTYHQFAGLGALCALCLTSAALVLVLFLVQAWMLARPAGTSTSSAPESASAVMASAPRPALWAAATLALVVLVGADVAYFSSLDPAAPGGEAAVAQAAPDGDAAEGATAPAERPSASPASARGAAPASPTAPGADTTDVPLPPGCGFMPGQEPVEENRLVSFSDPVFGNADAPVTVLEFFDPNCPHCKTFHSTMEGLISQFGDQARFVYKPIPLWRYSVNQIAALHVAAQQGKYEEMLEGQFARQQRGGLSNDQLADIAEEVGMNPDAMLAQIRENRYQEQIQRDRQLAIDSGLKGTPAVSIDGQLVARRARTPACVSALIQQQVQQTGS